MQAVKVLPKWQITIPKKIREKIRIEIGETLVIEEKGGQMVIQRGKTILDFAGTLPQRKESIEEIREEAVTEAARERT